MPLYSSGDLIHNTFRVEAREVAGKGTNLWMISFWALERLLAFLMNQVKEADILIAALTAAT